MPRGQAVALDVAEVVLRSPERAVRLGDLPGVVIVVLTRHHRCLLCQAHLSDVQARAGGLGVGLVMVGFGPPERVAATAASLGWQGEALADPERVLYRRLGLGRASLRAVYTPATLAFYARALRRGVRLERSEEDTRQLGGDAVLVDGVVRWLWQSASPDDRPSAEEVVAEANRLLPGGPPPTPPSGGSPGPARSGGNTSGVPAGSAGMAPSPTLPGPTPPAPTPPAPTPARAGLAAHPRVGRRRGLVGWLEDLERRTRPVDPETAAAYARRWEELPERSKTPAQTIGRHAVGCEGTHGVFPRCNFSCQPCYHSAEANRVRVDGAHTVRVVREQMRLLRTLRGPHGHCQLIGGEVSLLEPEDHAEVLAVMRAYGRNPMSFTHGDFDYDYLRRVAVAPDGTPRFSRLSFAAHFDTTMIGRRGIRRAARESDLNEYRQAFCDQFAKLRAEYGIRSYLAHNMTVTPDNVDQIPEVLAACRHMGFSMFSFQPAAYVGNQVRWKGDYRSLDPDQVWARIEEGAGAPLPWQVLQVGDERCNRTAWGFYVGDTWHSILDPADPKDLDARDRFFAHVGGVHFNAPPALLAARLARVAAAHPTTVTGAAAWVARTARRAGVGELVRHGVRPVTFVMHRFMHAEQVAPAWELLQRGETSDDPLVVETQERLRACSYAMAHPETGELVPACVQHSVLDPEENRVLAQLLPLPRRRNVEAGNPA
jgi:hypothetical protein